ncbi:MAG: heavy-metal-associated domain-containing protein [Merismopedia sp. SIO2A8]|nr:heavy-metal-associated domain-containing protein [Merismopedia sp. SIO2A8]
MTTLELVIPDMACSACVETITKAIQVLDASATVEANTQTKQLTINTTATHTVMKDAIATAGYTVST